MAAIKKFAWRVADRVGDFLDAAQFRIGIAWRVLRGKLPIEAERRSWDRGREVPILLEVSLRLDRQPATLQYPCVAPWRPLYAGSSPEPRQEGRAGPALVCEGVL